jgi:hypothetical protein
MSVSFESIALSGDQASQALPLVQATWPSVDLAAWERFVKFYSEGAAAGESGILALRNTAGYLCGVIAYRRDWDLQKGPILAVHVFTAIDLANSLQTVRGLLDAAEMRALELHCRGVAIHLGAKQGALGSRLHALGLSSQADVFWLKVEPAPTPS